MKYYINNLSSNSWDLGSVVVGPGQSIVFYGTLSNYNLGIKDIGYLQRGQDGTIVFTSEFSVQWVLVFILMWFIAIRCFRFLINIVSNLLINKSIDL
jgi:hypothetical protein